MLSKIFVPFNLSPELASKIEETLVGSQLTLSMSPPNSPADFAMREIVDTEIFYGGYLPPEQFELARQLKWVQVPFAGVNRLLSYRQIVESDITVTNSVGVSAPAIADQVLAYMLIFSRRLHDQFRTQQSKEWKHYDKLLELNGRTVGIIGHGNIGREVAKRARAFGMRVIATKHNTQGDYPELDLVLPSNQLNRLLTESDYVVMCVPLTLETQGMLGRAEFELMKPDAIFINIARGQVIKEAELINVLREKRIGGAALDVAEKEPLPAESPLWEMENVIVTPHSSGNFENFMPRSVELFCRNLQRYMNHEPLLNLVDKHRGY